MTDGSAGEEIRVDVVVDGSDRLDRWLAQSLPEVSRTALQRHIGAGRVSVERGGGPMSVERPSFRVVPGDRISIRLPRRAALPPPEPEDLVLPVVYRDADLLIVDKPRGMVTHPAAGHRRGTLVHGVAARAATLSGIGGVQRPGIVHRLDRGTSGLLVVARTDRAHRRLVEALAARRVERRYVALVEGHIEPAAGLVDGPIGRHPRDRKRFAQVAGGKPARTAYRVLARVGPLALVSLKLFTGRTHQIRVHLSGLGAPVLGDRVYGGGRRRLHHLWPWAPEGLFALHAWSLAFAHPRSPGRLSALSPVPIDMIRAWVGAGGPAEILRRLPTYPSVDEAAGCR